MTYASAGTSTSSAAAAPARRRPPPRWSGRHATPPPRPRWLPPKPKVIARPRRRGSARYISLRVVDRYFYKVTVRIRFYSHADGYLGARTYAATTARNPLNVYRPRPPIGAYSARGRCCN